MGANEAMSGGMNSSPICFPPELGSMMLILMFPPLFVFMKELKASPPFNNFGRIIISKKGNKSTMYCWKRRPK